MWECVTSVVFPGLAVERDVIDDTADRQIGDDGAAEEHVRRAALDIHKDRVSPIPASATSKAMA